MLQEEQVSLICVPRIRLCFMFLHLYGFVLLVLVVEVLVAGGAAPEAHVTTGALGASHVAPGEAAGAARHG